MTTTRAPRSPESGSMRMIEARISRSDADLPPPRRLFRLQLDRRRKLTLLVLAICYIVFVMLGGCADKLLLFPRRGHVEAHGALRKLIPFNGGSLEILIARSPGASAREPRAAILTFVGNAARAEDTAAWDAAQWGDHPVEGWTVNHPGFGGSTGAARLDRLAPAALAAYDALAAEAPGRPIILAGFSMGTAMALHVAARRPAAGLILRSPLPLRSLILGRHGWWNLWLLAGPVALGVPASLDSLRDAPNVTAPAVFVLTEADEIVPLKYQRLVVNAYGGPKEAVLSPDCLHNDPLTVQAQRQLEQKLDWLWNTIFQQEH